MQITLLHEPKDKTNYEKGDLLTYEGSETTFMVVGEDDLYLHTFTLDRGQYLGVFKLQPENLRCLVRVPK